MDSRFIEHIEAYVQGDIPIEALRERAKQSGIDDLEAEIEWYRKTVLGIEAEGLKSRLAVLYSEAGARPGDTDRTGRVVGMDRPPSRRLVPYTIAATVIILLGVFFLLKPSDDQKLYSEFLYEDPGIPVLMSATDRYELYDAMTYYSEGNYSAAIRKLERIDIEQAAFRDTVTYYLGASYLYYGNAPKAIDLFSKVAGMPGSDFRERAEWLTALAYLKLGKHVELTEALRPILDDTGHAFHEQAVSLAERTGL